VSLIAFMGSSPPPWPSERAAARRCHRGLCRPGRCVGGSCGANGAAKEPCALPQAASLTRVLLEAPLALCSSKRLGGSRLSGWHAATASLARPQAEIDPFPKQGLPHLIGHVGATLESSHAVGFPC